LRVTGLGDNLTYTLYLTTYNLLLTTYPLPLTTYNLSLTTYNLSLTTYVIQLTTFPLSLRPYSFPLTLFNLSLNSTQITKNRLIFISVQQLSLFEQMQLQKEVKPVVEIDESKLTKVYYTITEIAAMFHVNASLLRFWEKEFPHQLANIKKNKKGDRYYNKQDIANLKLIFHLVKEKRMTLEGARDYLKNNKKKVKDDKTLIENLEKIKEFLLDLKKNIQ